MIEYLKFHLANILIYVGIFAVILLVAFIKVYVIDAMRGVKYYKKPKHKRYDDEG